MEKYKYSCDGGSIMVGVKSTRICIPNNYGDGTHEVFIYDLDERFDDNGWQFKCTIEGSEINIYDYDCLYSEEFNDKSHILCALSGRYGVYANYGNIAIEKWD